jgi:hypothetical protein
MIRLSESRTFRHSSTYGKDKRVTEVRFPGGGENPPLTFRLVTYPEGGSGSTPLRFIFFVLA